MNKSVESTRLSVHPILNESISYAAWQNSVPLLVSLTVKNECEDTFENVSVRLDADNGCLRSRTWQINRLLPGEVVEIQDRRIELEPAYLGGLNEAEKCVVTFSVEHQSESVVSERCELQLLARNEWGGLKSNPELLASFVMPNDPAVGQLLRSASELLEKNGHSGSLEGYQTQNPKRIYLIIGAIWNSVCKLDLTYANPPKSFESNGQKVRTPDSITREKLATCLDTSLLFAAALEAAGLNSIVLFTRGHCFVGAWLLEKKLNRVVENDVLEIRKAIAGRELITFESTLASQSTPGSFESAIEMACSATEFEQEADFIGALDIQRARMMQIKPLASHTSTSNSEHSEPAAEKDSSLPLPSAPSWLTMPEDLSIQKPTTPSGRIDRWQRKLLDLTLRNRLLNFRSTLQTVPILCNEIAKLEDILAAGKKLKIISLPDQNLIGERDPELHRQQTDSDLNDEFAKKALENREVCCTLPSDQMDKRLVTLYRASRNDMAEGGTNTLFLAVGFLRWKRSNSEKKSYRAPLLLVPIKLTRRSSQSPFYLRMHEDETRFNATLIQMLKQDFGKNLTQFESELPTDENGIDVPKVLAMVRKHVRDVSGMEVVDECALGRFSFSKYLLWKDLVDRTDQLKNNRVVKHLLDGGERVFEDGQQPTPKPNEMDRLDPVDLIHPLDADSSQLAAVMAAADGKDFVLIGPPGTGKSQTITNIIAQCLATGKSVLFVAEKTAALDVVHRRLVQHGLGDCCVELHSNKAERKKFLAQMESNWTNNRRAHKNDWIQVNDKLKLRRDELNDYVQTINQRQPNGWTAFEAFWTSSNGQSRPRTEFEWSNETAHDELTYQSFEETAGELADGFQAIQLDAGLPMINQTEWSVQWERQLLEQSDQLIQRSDQLRKSLERFTDAIGLTGVADGSRAELESLSQLADAIDQANGRDLKILYHKQFSKFESAMEELEHSISLCHQSQQSVRGDFGSNIHTIPVGEIELQWRTACSKFWPFSWFAKRSVKKLLNTYTQSGSGADPATDLSAIKTFQAETQNIESSLLKEESKHWLGVETNVTELRSELSAAKELRNAIRLVGNPRKSTSEISQKLIPVIRGQSAGKSTIGLSRQFNVDLTNLLQSVETFSSTAGTQTDIQPLGPQTDSVCQSIRETGKHIREHRTELKRWTFWCRAKNRAKGCGLGPLAAQLESKEVSHDQTIEQFRVAYARWFIPRLVDSNEILKAFETVQHEQAIEDFISLDRAARKTASAKVLEAIAHGLPEPANVAKKSELGLLRHQMQLKRPSKSIRDVVNGMPDSFRKLAPCLLMSPLSIAQYLPANQPPFDVVVFDEASQITTWDAIGAIARGKQTIIVGDPKQLPPTNFFGKIEDDEFEDEEDLIDKDLESILDEAKASGLPELQLNWHYRSRHESLIAFSNYQYYGNRLITFPAADDDGKGVSLTIVPDAFYDLGKSRTNRVEAQAIVDQAMRLMSEQLRFAESDRRTFGVITFNMQQQSLIQDLFDQALRTQPELEWFFSDDRVEPTVVKNLENVQGDERDVMFFSITFGPTETNPKISLNFGALNKEGGHRRLNVAVTRSRQQMLIYSSFHPDQLDASRSQSRGLNDLKKFLLFADAEGEMRLESQTEGSVGGFDSPFEEAVSEALQSNGWEVVPQVGVSGFRIDLGIKHPHKPGSYLAGIECDGATYHRSATARDRDMTRQLVLEGLGWNILRIWSPDWWYDSEGVAKRVHQQLRSLLESETLESDNTQGPTVRTPVKMETETGNTESESE